jgi:BlaI family penicillinase repressor
MGGQMSDVPHISDAEWEVMRVAWRKGALTAQEAVQELEHRQWSPRTVKTLLNRLVKKGALSTEERGRAYLYRPSVRQQDCVRRESQSFLERVFAGATAPLLVHFVRSGKLSADEVDELKRILNGKKK